MRSPLSSIRSAPVRTAAKADARDATRVRRGIEVLLVTLLVAATILLLTLQNAKAMKIQTVKSPGGIEAWLVEDHSVPLIAMRFGFRGGSTQDPPGKEGVANFLTTMMDEGAGDLDAAAFQERAEAIAMRMSFSDARDAFYGNFETLTENRDAAVEMLRLALTKPRFDADAMERMRKQLLAKLAFAARDPSKVAVKEWYAKAFEGHAYARQATGDEASIAAITAADLEAFRKRNFARSNLSVTVVGDIDAPALGKLLDDVFGGLPEKADLVTVEKARPKAGVEAVIDMAVPQSVAVFGVGAMMRKDPDFMAGFVMNHILGGGGFSSLLMEEVREKRGLAYSVYSYLQPEEHASVLLGSVATKNEAIAESLAVIRDSFKRLATEGPTETELENAKSYLVGSYALRFDTSVKIASQLLGIKMEDLGVDYIETRNAQINAVTMADVKRVAAELLKPENLVVTVVGRPQNLPGAAKPAALQVQSGG
ncbi:MAG: M16 family metallopeptidase [Hyphomicrobiaceae bacterium]